MSGYLDAPELTATRIFKKSEGRRWYRTGDIGKYDDSLGYLYAGRIDRQVKLLGFRVELQEINRSFAARADRIWSRSSLGPPRRTAWHLAACRLSRVRARARSRSSRPAQNFSPITWYRVRSCLSIDPDEC